MSADIVVELSAVDVLVEGGGDVALRGVNWRIARGECWVVGGAPGSGKTSLLATAASLNRPGSGALYVFGRDLAEATEDEQVAWRRRIGYVFDGGGRLLSQLTVAQNIALPVQYHCDDLDETAVGRRVEQLLTRTELLTHARTMPSRLSLRLQQRACLARAVAVPTEILYLDNPLAGLGPRDARWWTEFLREQRGAAGNGPLTIVATCNDFRPWLEWATQFALVREGRFHALGNREQVLASDDPGVRELL